MGEKNYHALFRLTAKAPAGAFMGGLERHIGGTPKEVSQCRHGVSAMNFSLPGIDLKIPAGPESIDRGLSRVMSIAGLILLVGSAGHAWDQRGAFAPWWNGLGVSLIVALAVLALFPRYFSLRTLRIIWWVFPAMCLFLNATWSFALVEPRGTDGLHSRFDGLNPWVWEIEPVAVAMLVLAAPWQVAIANALVSPWTVVLSSWAATGETSTAVLSNTTVHVGNIAFVAILLGARKGLSELWKTEAAAAKAQNRLLKSQSREAALKQTSALIHDEVLSTLVVAMRTAGPAGDSLSLQATRALEVLSRGKNPWPSGDTTSSELTKIIASRAATLSEDVVFTDSGPEIPLPANVARAMKLATIEALRNVVSHAEASMISINIKCSTAAITIAIADDGIGFNVNKLPADRAGVRESIEARMKSLHGGRAIIISSPGNGTTVRLSWSAL